MKTKYFSSILVLLLFIIVLFSAVSCQVFLPLVDINLMPYKSFKKDDVHVEMPIGHEHYLLPLEYNGGLENVGGTELVSIVIYVGKSDKQIHMENDLLVDDYHSIEGYHLGAELSPEELLTDKYKLIEVGKYGREFADSIMVSVPQDYIDKSATEKRLEFVLTLIYRNEKGNNYVIDEYKTINAEYKFGCLGRLRINKQY